MPPRGVRLTPPGYAAPCGRLEELTVCPSPRLGPHFRAAFAPAGLSSFVCLSSVSAAVRVCETDWGIILPASLNVSRGSRERFTSLADPLVFLKLRDQLLAPLLAVRVRPGGPAGHVNIADDAVYSLYCGGSSASVGGSADHPDFAGWEHSANLLASLLATLWIHLFRVNLARYTTAALHSALAALVPLCQACYGLLSPVFAAGAGPVSSWFAPSCSLVPSFSAAGSLLMGFSFDDGHRLQVAQRSLETLERFLSPSVCDQFDLNQIFGLVLLFRLSLGVWCTDTVILRLAVASQTAQSEGGSRDGMCTLPVFPTAFPAQLAHVIVHLLLWMSHKDYRQSQPDSPRSSIGHLETWEAAWWAVRSLLYDCLVLLFGVPVFATRISSLDRLADNQPGSLLKEKRVTKPFTSVSEDEYLSQDSPTLSGVAVALLASLRKDPAAKAELFSILLRDARRLLVGPGEVGDCVCSSRLISYGGEAGKAQYGHPADQGAQRVRVGPFELVIGSLRVLNFLVEALVPTQLLYEGVTCSGGRGTGKRGAVRFAEDFGRGLFSPFVYAEPFDGAQRARAITAGTQRKHAHGENDARGINLAQSEAEEEQNAARRRVYSEAAGHENDEPAEGVGACRPPSDVELLAAIVLAHLYAGSRDPRGFAGNAQCPGVGYSSGPRAREKQMASTSLSFSVVMGLASSQGGVRLEAKREELVLATIRLIKTACTVRRGCRLTPCQSSCSQPCSCTASVESGCSG